VGLGAQDVHWEDKGAYTGEVSAPMLVDMGCRFVLVGHSERRIYFGESGAMLLSKLRAALRQELTPILCVGERLEEREAGETEQVLERQLAETLLQLEPGQAARVALAYEPVWAIGTGRTATPEQAGEAHAFLRRTMEAGIGAAPAREIPILYGGSVSGANAHSLLARPGIDGALVGGASLRPSEFLTIAGAAAGA
jgi:triosephosphate isomerase